MSQKSSASNVETIERRRDWCDRRAGSDRRNLARLTLTNYDCRSVLPRRAADIAGELAEGDIWWNKSAIKHE